LQLEPDDNRQRFLKFRDLSAQDGIKRRILSVGLTVK
jgi:hypothetical protein